MVEQAVRESFETFRARAADRVEHAWGELAARFRGRTQERVDAIRRAASDLLAIELPTIVVPPVGEQQERFFYLFLHVGSTSEGLDRVARRLLPANVVRRRLLRRANDQLRREFDKHAGRMRWDLTQRLDSVRRRFETAMSAELERTVDAIVAAASRADELRAATLEELERRAGSDERALRVAELVARSAPSSAPTPHPAAFGTVYVVRHGRTALNAAGVLRGRLDPPLDAVGEQQAHALGELFADSHVDAVVCSPLQRARQTAGPIADATGATLACEDALVDRDYGPWAGTARADVEARFGSLDRTPEIEPMGSLVSRVVFAASEVAVRFDSVVIVAHEVVNRALLASLASNTVDDPDAIPQRTGCWNELEYVDAEWVATVVDALPGDGEVPRRRHL